MSGFNSNFVMMNVGNMRMCNMCMAFGMSSETFFDIKRCMCKM